MKAGVETRVRDVIARILQVEASTIDDRASSQTLARWDSLHHITLVFALEEEFGVTFSEVQIVALISFPAIVSILEETARRART